MSTDVEVFDDRVCVLGEGPFHDAATGKAGWVDILGGRVLWRHPQTGEVAEITCGAHVGAAIPRAGGGLVLCLPDGPVLNDRNHNDQEWGGYAEADRAAGAPLATTLLRSNDAKPDPVGRLWLGTVAYDNTPGAAALYRLDPGASSVTRVVGRVSNSNGLGWTADGATMYYVDTPTGRIDAFDYEPASGHLERRRTFAEIPPDAGVPDGLCTDSEGGVWVALWGGAAVRRYRPDSVLDREIRLPTAQVTSCAFVGPDHDLLIITTAAIGLSDPGAGRTYLHQPGDVAGVPVPPFAG